MLRKSDAAKLRVTRGGPEEVFRGYRQVPRGKAGGRNAGGKRHPSDGGHRPRTVVGMLAAGAERLHGILASAFHQEAGAGRKRGKQTTRKT